MSLRIALTAAAAVVSVHLGGPAAEARWHAPDLNASHRVAAVQPAWYEHRGYGKHHHHRGYRDYGWHRGYGDHHHWRHARRHWRHHHWHHDHGHYPHWWHGYGGGGYYYARPWIYYYSYGW